MAFKRKQTALSASAALQRLKRYCAIQERSPKEVHSKLLELGITGEALEEVIARLITEGFLNENRFAIAFARGKFRMKGWGTRKIEYALKSHNISADNIQKAISALDQKDYVSSLERDIKKKIPSVRGGSLKERKQKLIRYFIAKGYDFELTSDTIDRILAND